jgi:hypothetical protein
MCALGRGHSITAVAESEQAANFTRCLMTFDSRGKAEKWRKVLLDPDLSIGAFSAVWTIGNFPESGFADAESYSRWRTTNEPKVEEQLASYTADHSH